MSQTIDTSSGPIHVTVDGPTNQAAVIMYPDIGMTAEFCFSTVVGMMKSAGWGNTLTFVYIDPPGMEDGAHEFDSGSYPSWDAQKDQVRAVRKALGFTESVFGMGVGLGAALLGNIAVDDEDFFLGLVLIGPNGKPSGIAEWSYETVGAITLSWFGTLPFIEQQLVARYFSAHHISTNDDAVKSYHTELKKISKRNLADQIRTYGGRHGYMNKLSALKKTRSMLVVGSQSYYKEDTIDVFAQIPAGSASMMEVGGTGHLVPKDNPKTLLEPMLLFFQGFGLASLSLTDEEIQASRDAQKLNYHGEVAKSLVSETQAALHGNESV